MLIFAIYWSVPGRGWLGKSVFVLLQSNNKSKLLSSPYPHPPHSPPLSPPLSPPPPPPPPPVPLLPLLPLLPPLTIFSSSSPPSLSPSTGSDFLSSSFSFLSLFTSARTIDLLRFCGLLCRVIFFCETENVFFLVILHSYHVFVAFTFFNFIYFCEIYCHCTRSSARILYSSLSFIAVDLVLLLRSPLCDVLVMH